MLEAAVLPLPVVDPKLDKEFSLESIADVPVIGFGALICSSQASIIWSISCVCILVMFCIWGGIDDSRAYPFVTMVLVRGSFRALLLYAGIARRFPGFRRGLVAGRSRLLRPALRGTGLGSRH
jgi:hypothetical protein